MLGGIGFTQRFADGFAEACRGLALSTSQVLGSCVYIISSDRLPNVCVFVNRPAVRLLAFSNWLLARMRIPINQLADIRYLFAI